MSLQFGELLAGSVLLASSGQPLSFSWRFEWEYFDERFERFRPEPYWPSTSNPRNPLCNHGVHVPTPFPRGARVWVSSLSGGGKILPPIFLDPINTFHVSQQILAFGAGIYEGDDSAGNHWEFTFQSLSNSAIRPPNFNNWEQAAFPIGVEVVVTNGSSTALLYQFDGILTGTIPVSELEPVRCTLIGSGQSGTAFSSQKQLRIWQVPDSSPCGRELGAQWPFRNAWPSLSLTQNAWFEYEEDPSGQNRVLTGLGGENQIVQTPKSDYRIGDVGAGWSRRYCFSAQEFSYPLRYVQRFTLLGAGRRIWPQFPLSNPRVTVLRIGFRDYVYAGGRFSPVFTLFQTTNFSGVSTWDVLLRDTAGSAQQMFGGSQDGGFLVFELAQELRPSMNPLRPQLGDLILRDLGGNTIHQAAVGYNPDGYHQTMDISPERRAANAALPSEVVIVMLRDLSGNLLTYPQIVLTRTSVYTEAI